MFYLRNSVHRPGSAPRRFCSSYASSPSFRSDSGGPRGTLDVPEDPRLLGTLLVPKNRHQVFVPSATLTGAKP